MWRCTHCSQVWSAAEVFPSGEKVEQDIEQLVMYLELRLGCSLEGNQDPKLLEDAHVELFEAALETARCTLGMRHWASIKLLCLQSLWLCVQLSRDVTERAVGLPNLTACLHTLHANDEWLWHFCAASGTQPHFFAHVGRNTLDVLAHHESALEEAPQRSLTARCAAIVVAGDVHGLPAQREGGGSAGLADLHAVKMLRTLDVPPTCAGIAEVLSMAGDGELKADAAGSALLFFRRAHLYDPLSDEISSRIKAAMAAMEAMRG